jgi:drug/metabolite transporter (DMT)-like permease
MARRDLLDLLVLGAIWGAAFLFIRVAVPEFGPVALVEVRVIIAAALLMGLVVIRGQLGAFRGRWGALTLIGALNTAVPFALFAYATQTVPAGFAAVLNSTTPLFGALLGGAFFGERLGFTRALGLGIGFAGVVVLVARDLALVGGPPAIGAALLGALLYAISAHLTHRLLGGVPSLVIAAGSLVASAVMLAIPAALLWPAARPSPAAWGSTLALAVLATALGYILYFRLLERVGATRAISVTYLIPLFGMVWGATFLHERITLPMLLGCGLILFGVAVTTGALRRLLGRA